MGPGDRDIDTLAAIHAIWRDALAGKPWPPEHRAPVTRELYEATLALRAAAASSPTGEAAQPRREYHPMSAAFAKREPLLDTRGHYRDPVPAGDASQDERHATTWSGDCPHWCRACASRAAAQPAAAVPADLTEDLAWRLAQAAYANDRSPAPAPEIRMTPAMLVAFARASAELVAASPGGAAWEALVIALRQAREHLEAQALYSPSQRNREALQSAITAVDAALYAAPSQPAAAVPADLKTYSSLDYLKTAEDLEEYVQERIRLAAAELVAAAPSAQPVALGNVEQYQLQMAAISTAALGYWKEGDYIHPPYDTVALRDVARLYAKYAALYAAAAPSVPARLTDEQIDALWKAYQLGQVSADHTAKEVFAEVLRINLPAALATAQPAAAVPADLHAADYEAHQRNGLAWAVSRWQDEVSQRPLVNVHRRTLDDTWRQVIRYFGGDPAALVGPDHDTLHMQAQEDRAWKP